MACCGAGFAGCGTRCLESSSQLPAGADPRRAERAPAQRTGPARAPRPPTVPYSGRPVATVPLVLSDAIASGLLDVALPAAFAGIVAILATIAVERLGGVAGGILSSVPTTIVPAAIGIYGRNPDVDSFRRAMAFVPVGILMNALYLVLWRVVPARLGRHTRRHLLLATTLVTLGAWFVVASGVVAANHLLAPTLPQSLATGGIAAVAGLLLGIAANRVPHPAPRGTHRVGTAILLVRGIAATAVIGSALLLARAGLPVASGIASVIPAIFTTIMIATWLAQGAHVPTGAVGPMALGTLSVSAYALLAAALFPIMPLWVAASVCWIASVAGVSVPAYLAVRASRARRHASSPRRGMGVERFEGLEGLEGLKGIEGLESLKSPKDDEGGAPPPAGTQGQRDGRPA